MPTKRIISAILLALLVGCSNSYPSAEEANNACLKWEAEGKKIKIDLNASVRERLRIASEITGTEMEEVEDLILDKSIRSCKEEVRTKQILGKEINISSVKKQPITPLEYEALDTSIKKYFKY
jgi:hypothetical protein